MEEEFFTVIIDNRKFDFWSAISVNLKYDSVASLFSIQATINESNESNGAFIPFSYKPIKIYVGAPRDGGSPDTSNLILTGVITNHDFTTEADPQGVQISGYSLTGVLQDCEIPTEAYPLQDDGKTLSAIAQKILDPFGLELFVNQIARADAQKAIAKASAKETDKCSDYITKLASQYNVIVGHTRKGRLLFTRVRATERPRSNYVEGSQPLLKVSLSANGTAIYSRHTILRQPSFGDTEATNPQEVVPNRLVNVFRPQVKTQSQGGTDTTASAAKSARMAGLKAVKVNIEVDKLRFDDGTIIKPNRVINITAPSVRLLGMTTLFVNNVTLSQDPGGVSSTMECVLKEAMTGEQASNIF